MFPEEITEPNTESPLNISGIKLNTINAIHQEDSDSSDNSDPEKEEVNLTRLDDFEDSLTTEDVIMQDFEDGIPEHIKLTIEGDVEGVP